MIKVNFKKLSKNAVVPTKAHPSDAGFDMVAVSKNETEDYIEYKTDIAIKLPKGHCALLFPRSSVSKYDLSLCNSVGLIDENYTGNIIFRYKKTPKYQYYSLKRLFGFVKDLVINPITYKEYNVGDKIGQIVIMPIPSVELIEVNELPDTDRGDGGFGSTDAKVADVQEMPSKSRRKRKSSK